jgi:hypothetical protein
METSEQASRETGMAFTPSPVLNLRRKKKKGSRSQVCDRVCTSTGMAVTPSPVLNLKKEEEERRRGEIKRGQYSNPAYQKLGQKARQVATPKNPISSDLRTGSTSTSSAYRHSHFKALTMVLPLQLREQPNHLSALAT